MTAPCSDNCVRKKASVGDFLLLTEGNSCLLSVTRSVCLHKAIVTLGAGTVLVRILEIKTC